MPEETCYIVTIGYYEETVIFKPMNRTDAITFALRLRKGAPLSRPEEDWQQITNEDYEILLDQYRHGWSLPIERRVYYLQPETRKRVIQDIWTEQLGIGYCSSFDAEQVCIERAHEGEMQTRCACGDFTELPKYPHKSC